MNTEQKPAVELEKMMIQYENEKGSWKKEKFHEMEI